MRPRLPGARRSRPAPSLAFRLARRCVLGVALVATSASAVELQLAPSALEKALKAQLFRNDGKWRLGKAAPCNDAWFERPSLQIREGRLVLRARFAGHLGAEVMGTCVQGGEPSWVTVSGRPVVGGTVLSLQDVRVDEIEKPNLRSIAGSLLEAATRSALKVDLQQTLSGMLAQRNTAPYAVDLSGLAVHLVDTAPDRLNLSVDFRLSVR